MFGLALRSYHRKLRRIEGSATTPGESLWQAVLRIVGRKKTISQLDLWAELSEDDPAVIRGIVSDMVESGVLDKEGSGPSAVLTPSSLNAGSPDSDDGLKDYIWALLYRDGPLSAADVSALSHQSPDRVRAILGALIDDGMAQTTATDGTAAPCYVARDFIIPPGEDERWPLAVYDHFAAVVRSICSRLAGAQGSHGGGSTYEFNLWRGHPMEKEVLQTLQAFRQRNTELRERVDQWNESHAPSGTRYRVTCYAGQFEIDDGDGGQKAVQIEKKADEE
jgi:hypothetical protein